MWLLNSTKFGFNEWWVIHIGYVTCNLKEDTWWNLKDCKIKLILKNRNKYIKWELEINILLSINFLKKEKTNISIEIKRELKIKKYSVVGKFFNETSF